ncbi:FAD-dependent oxidoreductase [Halomicrococcus sp. NG-SE-24]|uniref:FAD-dependent oxidoreductase n=1 Tax=Halomicrococcus sp. NG-SE-24 TaxID=3436928 RepID=UPI003D981D3F
MGEPDLPGRDASLWLETTETTDFDPLDGDVRVDVAVVGGGIAGLSAATELQDAGETVAVVEADRIVSGVTARTTAKVTAQHGLIYDDVRSEFGPDRARQYAQANEAAVEEVASRADDLDCEFRRLPAYTYVDGDDARKKVRREVDAARRLGLPASFVEDVPDPVDADCAVRFDDQGQFHPRKYLLALAEVIPGEGSYVFEETRATDIEAGEPCRVETNRGSVTADDVVVATHFPISDPAGYFARAYPKRSYVLAVRTNDPQPEGMFYRTGDSYFSVRPHETDDEEFVLVGGQNHKTGQGGSTAERYRRLEREARDHFDVESVAYRWSTQDYVSADSVPFVGPIAPWRSHVYVATGFGGWGMTNGTAAGKLLADEIAGTGSEWADAFDPGRLPPLESAGELLKENANAGKRFAGDWATKLRRSEASLAPGDAHVVRDGGDVVAEYRDEDGDRHRVSAVCTHLDCLVEWNDAERTWDCPCHGSRFDVDGGVLDGPANSDLPKK